jgi:hypothetical protein
VTLFTNIPKPSGTAFMKGLLDLGFAPAHILRARHRSPLLVHACLAVLACMCVAVGQTDRTRAPAVRSRGIGSVGVVPLDICVYHLTSGGIHEYDDKLSESARGSMAKEVAGRLKAHGMKWAFVDTSGPYGAALREVQAILGSIDRTVRSDDFGTTRIGGRIAERGYSVGSIRDLCEQSGIDALLVVWGYDEERTERRRQMIAGAIAGSVASAVVGALIGVGGHMAVPRSDICFLCAALVAPDGRVVWYNYALFGGGLSLADDSDARKATAELLEGLPD